MTDNEYDAIALIINELIEKTDIYNIVRWETKDGNQYQLLDCQGNELYLVEYEKGE